MNAVRAQSSPLNDTGQTACYQSDSTLSSNCTIADAAMPGQDARFGRDAAPAAGQLPAKAGGGNAGFDFTALDASGTVTLGSHACVRDNVTGLIWSTESLNWASANNAEASCSRCGYTGGWRLPTRHELLSIVDFSRTAPAIDSDYFPNTQSAWYGTPDGFAPGGSGTVWCVDFETGKINGCYTLSAQAHLVRSEQP